MVDMAPGSRDRRRSSSLDRGRTPGCRSPLGRSVWSMQSASRPRH